MDLKVNNCVLLSAGISSFQNWPLHISIRTWGTCWGRNTNECSLLICSYSTKMMLKGTLMSSNLLLSYLATKSGKLPNRQTAAGASFRK